MNIVVVSGGFDPIHLGHIDMLRDASRIGDKVVVILNNDNWLTNKKGKPFMDEESRKRVVESIEFVDDVILTEHEIDDDDMSVVKDLEKIDNITPDLFSLSEKTDDGWKQESITFANGGDRVTSTTPEVNYCLDNGVMLAFNVGGSKKRSSSQYIKEWEDYNGNGNR